MRRARWSGFSHIGIFAVLGGLAAAVSLIPSSVGRAALQKAAQSDVPAPESHVLSADDGFNIHIRYYRSPAESTKDAAVVVLLHMKDGNRFVWEQDGGIAQALQSKGFAVVTVDLRYHGESKANGAAP
ncbi:MAG: hypothetical protein JSS02_12000, partial [Planctomycetes bacterium]|nr:hypothetical protein [Planctomycetota bacterium]